MADMKHVVEVDAPPEVLFGLVSSSEGFAQWWTRRAQGDATPGGGLSFEFPGGTHRWRTSELTDRTFEMECLDDSGGPEWIGTRLRFEVEPAGGGSRLRFQHLDWREPTDFFGHCNFTWGRFLMGLKVLAEGGEARPVYGDDAAR